MRTRTKVMDNACSNNHHKSSQAAVQIVSKIFENSMLFEGKKETPIPSFVSSEITPGPLLGMGEFCSVRAISKIDVGDQLNRTESRQIGSNQDQDILLEKRGKIIGSFSRKKAKRYAIKYLHQEADRLPSQYQTGIVDITVETKILSALDHPNIIKLCGYNERALFSPDYFIIIERLDYTLSDLMCEWKKINTKNKINSLISIKNRKYLKPSFQNIIKIGMSVSSAISYLHKKRVLHRDIKPDNMGFDSAGELKIFDFGLSTELSKEKRNAAGLYRMTGNTGSRRYMAPEIAREEPYNESVDVYSIGIILWEMIAKETAFDGYSIDLHSCLVVECGIRPKIEPTWPLAVQEIIERCWAHDYRSRPSAHKLCSYLQEMMVIKD